MGLYYRLVGLAIEVKRAKSLLLTMRRSSTVMSLAVLLPLLLAGCSSLSSSQSAQNQANMDLSQSANTIPDNSWVPSGYYFNDAVAAAGVAYQWQTAAQNPKLQNDYCGKDSGFINTYCRFLSVKVNAICTPRAHLQLLDQNGNVQGQTETGDGLASNPISLEAGQKTTLVFRISTDYPKVNLLYIAC